MKKPRLLIYSLLALIVLSSSVLLCFLYWGKKNAHGARCIIAHPKDPNIVAYIILNLESGENELRLRNFKRGDVQVLLDLDVHISPVGWNADGKRILVRNTKTSEYTYFDLDRGKISGESFPMISIKSFPTKGTPGLGSAALSPSGKYLAEIRVVRGEDGRVASNIWITDLQNGDSRVITGFDIWDWCALPTLGISWSGREDKIVFTIRDVLWKREYDNPLVEEDRIEHGWLIQSKKLFTDAVLRLCIVDISTGELEPRITETNINSYLPSYAPNGKAIAYIGSKGVVLNLEILILYGVKHTLLENVDPMQPSWSADMKYIYAAKDGKLMRVEVPRHIQKEITK